MAGRKSRARNAKPGSARVRDPAAGTAATGRRSAPGWMTTVPVDLPDAEDPDGELAERARVDPERDDPESVARLICLRLLTAAPRTQAELATALRRRGVPEDAAQAVLARFTEVKLIDDAMFARAWVETRHHGRGLAGRALREELRRKGVAAEDIATALEELDPDQELATARELIARRLPGTRGQPGPARRRRPGRQLPRRHRRARWRRGTRGIRGVRRVLTCLVPPQADHAHQPRSAGLLKSLSA